MKKEPTMLQAAYYSATLSYLQAVKAAGTTDSDKVMAALRKQKINDLFVKGGYIRADGLLVHDMYVMQVKSPAESKYPWDYYRLVRTIPGEEAYGPLSDSTCPLLKK
jgi:branched-chain amino acid transport system substrate-binding protein